MWVGGPCQPRARTGRKPQTSLVRTSAVAGYGFVGHPVAARGIRIAYGAGPGMVGGFVLGARWAPAVAVLGFRLA
jgi:hypothetical protein